MKPMRPALLSTTLALLLSAAGATGQGSFQNLDFESANIPAGTQPGSDVAINAAFPGWIASYSSYMGTAQATSVWYDNVSLGGAAISIIDTHDVYGPLPLQDNYSAYLFGGNNAIGYPGGLTSSTISQTGLIPYGAVSIIMVVQAQNGFSVSLGGQTIITAAGPTSGGFSADISAFAGQTAELSITAPPVPFPGINPNPVLVDDIRFVPVPEPNVITLSAVSNGTNVVIGVTNGLTGGAFYLLTSTNLGLARSQWTIIATNYGVGYFEFTNQIDPNVPQKFYSIALP